MHSQREYHNCFPPPACPSPLLLTICSGSELCQCCFCLAMQDRAGPTAKGWPKAEGGTWVGAVRRERGRCRATAFPTVAVGNFKDDLPQTIFYTWKQHIYNFPCTEFKYWAEGGHLHFKVILDSDKYSTPMASFICSPLPSHFQLTEDVLMPLVIGGTTNKLLKLCSVGRH